MEAQPPPPFVPRRGHERERPLAVCEGLGEPSFFMF